MARIISGLRKGMKLNSLNTLDVRPTTDRVKESLFNILHTNVRNAKVLDLCAGIGSFGLEAASRDASNVVCIEKNTAIFQVLLENKAAFLKTEISKECQIECLNEDVLHFLDRTHQLFDIIFLDPPYENQTLYFQIFERLVFLGNENTQIIVESEVLFDMKEKLSKRFTIVDERRYGKTKLTFLKINQYGVDEI